MKLNNILFFLIYIFFNPSLLSKWLKFRLYLPVFVQYVWLKKYKIATFIDVGAYKGYVSATVRHLFKNAEIYAFEPNLSLHKEIKMNTNGNVFLSSIALGQKITNKKFYLDPRAPHLSSFLTNNKVTPVLATMTTIDNFFSKKKLKRHVFLKIDTQGTEYEVLLGSKKTLNSVSFVHVETSFKKSTLQASFDKVYRFLINHGFYFAGEAKEAHFYPTYGSQEAINALFIRKGL